MGDKVRDMAGTQIVAFKKFRDIQIRAYGTTQADWGNTVFCHFAWFIARLVAPKLRLV